MLEPPESVPVDAEPAAAGGESAFLHGTSVLAENEALLFRDDLMITVESIPRLTSVLALLIERARSVCLIRSENVTGRQHGTGFRITDDLVLTNWHVLHFGGGETTRIELRFHYDDDGTGEARPTTPLYADISSIIGDKADDWAVVRVKNMPADAPAVSLADVAEPRVSSAAYVIQHPGGRPKRIAFVRNQISFADDRVIQYLSDTQQGSSGSPVFDEEGRLTGLHRKGGIPQEKVGRPPLKKNEGVRLSVIAEALKARGIAGVSNRSD